MVIEPQNFFVSPAGGYLRWRVPEIFPRTPSDAASARHGASASLSSPRQLSATSRSLTHASAVSSMRGVLWRGQMGKDAKWHRVFRGAVYGKRIVKTARSGSCGTTPSGRRMEVVSSARFLWATSEIFQPNPTHGGKWIGND